MIRESSVYIENTLSLWTDQGIDGRSSNVKTWLRNGGNDVEVEKVGLIRDRKIVRRI